MDEKGKWKKSMKPSDDFFAEYNPGKLLGQGAICEGVYQCELKLTGEMFAVKILDRAKLKFFDR